MPPIRRKVDTEVSTLPVSIQLPRSDWRPAGGAGLTRMYPVLSLQLTNLQHDRQPPAAPLQPLAPADPELTLYARVLREALMRDGRTFDLIRKPADGSDGWRTVPYQCFEPEAVAAMVTDPAWIVGLRHRHQTRLIAIDLDNHGFENWRPDSPRLIALQAAAEAAGIVPSVHRTTNGLHLWLAIPEAVPKVRAHWVLRVLLQRAEVDSVELFPSLATGSAITDARARPRSNGIRLPGQPGGALWVGDRWIDDPVLIWQELEANLEAAEVGPAWQELVEAAAAMEQEYKRSCRRLPSRPCAHRPPGGGAPVEWTGTGQSNRLLFDLAQRGYREGHRDCEALATYIESQALDAPGFNRWASMDTRRRLSPWAMEKAKWLIAHPPTAGCRPRSNDPGRNARLKRESFCSLLAGCERAHREFGEAALPWSARKIAEYTGIARTTLARLRFHWQLRLLALLHQRRSGHPAGGGSDPYSKGGDQPAVVPASSIHPFIHGPASPGRFPSGHLCRPPSTADPPPMPTTPNKIASHPWLADRRVQEREELARWLGAAT